jgi:hypothetical protein
MHANLGPDKIAVALSGVARTRRNFTKAAVRAAAAGAVALTAMPRPGSASVACFLEGTRIRTTAGDRRVEDLSIGDMLPAVGGDAQAIEWIGRHVFRKSDGAKPWVHDIRPVRISRSALADGVPSRDLYVTQGHGLFIDGVLVAAGSLVNDTTIVRVDPREREELMYFHIKLARHDIIFAEEAPCETLLNVDENASNFAEYFRRYGRPVADQAPFAPVLAFTGGRSEVSSRLRSALSPLYDARRPLDVIRGRLEERGLAMSKA